MASSVSAEQTWGSVKAGYTLAGDQFRRIIVQTPLNSETDRENVLVTFHPKPFFDLSAGRFNFLQPLTPTGGTIRATLDEYTAAREPPSSPSPAGCTNHSCWGPLRMVRHWVWDAISPAASRSTRTFTTAVSTALPA
ncbi:MAG: hypothetical protein WAM78_22555 [Candidatus Sulfotelmatobacter sp.]